MLSRTWPIFLVFGVALVVGLGVIIAALAEGDPDPAPTLSDFAAAQAAKRAYHASDQSADLATCTTKSWDAETDVWQVECTLEREGGTTELTQWRVTPDGTATRINGGATPTTQA